jgi:DeoR/GlpR family transcriptional regulator of sugar metabolism
MQSIRVRTAILGAGGIVPEGIYNSNLLLVETERQMMECGQEVIIVADHSKFGWLSLCWLCGLEDIDRVVVDPGLPDEYRALLEAADVKIHVAPLATESLHDPEDGHARVRDRGRAPAPAPSGRVEP